MRIAPNDEDDFAYPVTCLRSPDGGIVRYKGEDRKVHTVTLGPDEVLNLPVRRVYETGTTARELHTSLVGQPTHGHYVPYARRDVNLLTSLLAFYTLNSTFEDSSGNGYDLTAHGGTFGPGFVAGSAYAAGYADVADVGLTPGGSYSLSAWFFRDPSTTSDAEVFRVGDLIVGSQLSDQSVLVRRRSTGRHVLSGGRFTGTRVPVANGERYVWRNVVVTKSSSLAVVVYVDGVPVADGHLSDANAENAPLVLSALAQTLSQVGVWGKVLSPSAVKAIYNDGDGGDPTT